MSFTTGLILWALASLIFVTGFVLGAVMSGQGEE